MKKKLLVFALCVMSFVLGYLFATNFSLISKEEMKRVIEERYESVFLADVHDYDVIDVNVIANVLIRLRGKTGLDKEIEILEVVLDDKLSRIEILFENNSKIYGWDKGVYETSKYARDYQTKYMKTKSE